MSSAGALGLPPHLHILRIHGLLRENKVNAVCQIRGPLFVIKLTVICRRPTEGVAIPPAGEGGGLRREHRAKGLKVKWKRREAPGDTKGRAGPCAEADPS